MSHRLFKRHGAYYYDLGRDEAGRRRCLHLGRNEEQAFARYATIKGIATDEAGLLRRHFVKIFDAAKSTARRRGIPFELTRDELADIIFRSGLRCEITGIPFSMSWAETPKHKRPYVPSLDRRDSTKGYTAANCRLVLCAVNYALNEWGEKTLRRIFGGQAVKVADNFDNSEGG